jgi:hypothetical protein
MPCCARLSCTSRHGLMPGCDVTHHARPPVPIPSGSRRCPHQQTAPGASSRKPSRPSGFATAPNAWLQRRSWAMGSRSPAPLAPPAPRAHADAALAPPAPRAHADAALAPPAPRFLSDGDEAGHGAVTRGSVELLLASGRLRSRRCAPARLARGSDLRPRPGGQSKFMDRAATPGTAMRTGVRKRWPNGYCTWRRA